LSDERRRNELSFWIDMLRDAISLLAALFHWRHIVCDRDADDRRDRRNQRMCQRPGSASARSAAAHSILMNCGSARIHCVAEFFGH
jgi:hypothetical protein